jgi:hypothetical protein
MQYGDCASCLALPPGYTYDGYNVTCPQGHTGRWLGHCPECGRIGTEWARYKEQPDGWLAQCRNGHYALGGIRDLAEGCPLCAMPAAITPQLYTYGITNFVRVKLDGNIHDFIAYKNEVIKHPDPANRYMSTHMHGLYQWYYTVVALCEAETKIPLWQIRCIEGKSVLTALDGTLVPCEEGTPAEAAGILLGKKIEKQTAPAKLGQPTPLPDLFIPLEQSLALASSESQCHSAKRPQKAALPHNAFPATLVE